MFKEYFGYQSPSFLAEDLLKVNNNKNNQTANQTIFSINLKKYINNEIPKNENKTKKKKMILLKELLSLIKNKKELDLKYSLLNKCFKGKRLLIALGQVKAGNSSQSLLNGFK